MESDIEQLLNYQPSDFSSSEDEHGAKEIESIERDELPKVRSLKMDKNQPIITSLADKEFQVADNQLLSSGFEKDSNYSDLFKLSITDSDSEINIDESVIEEKMGFFNLMDEAINKYTRIYNQQQKTHLSLQKEKVQVEDYENLNIYITNFYNVTQKLLKSKQSQKNYTLTKSITFAIGAKFYVAISDISGCIIFYNLKSKSIELLESNSDTTGYCTALEFTKDARYLFCGFYMGDIKIYEVASLMIVQGFNGVFLNPVVRIFPYNEHDFVVHDNSSTMATINVKRSYFLYNNFESAKIDFFSSYKILCTTMCSIQSIEGEKSGSVDLLLSCLDKNKISLFQVSPVKQNIELFYLHDYLTCIDCSFNKTNYGPKKAIYFYILASTSLLVYSIAKSNEKMTSVPLLDIDISTNFVHATWLNDITIALIDDRMKKVVLYNLQAKKSGNTSSGISLEGMVKETRNKKLGKNTSEMIENIDYKMAQENIQDEMKDFEPINKLADTIKARVMKTVENPHRVTAIDHKGQIVDLKLKNWREYFDYLFEKKTLDVYLKKFNEVFEGDYCFFNDYIQDKTTRERIMVSYLQDKIQNVFEETPAVAEAHLTDIMGMFFSMKQYDFVYNYLYSYYENKGSLSVFYNKLEHFLNKRTIKYLQQDFAINLIEHYTKNNQHDIVMLILGNLEAQSTFIDPLIEFCISNNYWISLIIVCFNSKPPSINKLLYILRTKIYLKSDHNRISYKSDARHKLYNNVIKSQSPVRRKNSMPIDILESLAVDKKDVHSSQISNLVISEDDFRDIKKVLFWVYHFFLEKSIHYTNLSRTYYDVVIAEFYAMLNDRVIIELFIDISIKDFIKILISFYTQRNYGALCKSYFKEGKQPSDLLKLINCVDSLDTMDKIFFSYLFDEMLDFVDSESVIDEPVKHYNNMLELLKQEDKYIFKEYTDFLCDSLEKNIKLFSIDELSKFITKIIELYSSNVANPVDNLQPSISKFPNTEPNFSKTDFLRTPMKKIEAFDNFEEQSLSHSAVLKKSNTEFKNEFNRKVYESSHWDTQKQQNRKGDNDKVDFLDDIKNSFMSDDQNKERTANLPILSLLTEILYRIEEYDTIFKIWALQLTTVTKKFMFHFLAKKIFNINLQKQFINNLIFFVMCSIDATFALLDLFDILPYFNEIDLILANLFSVKLKFYDYMLARYKEACYERKSFFHNYVEALIKEEDEKSILQFLKTYCEYIEIFEVLKLLSGTNYYKVFAFLYEISKDEVKAFSYYFVILKNMHLKLEKVDFQEITKKWSKHVTNSKNEKACVNYHLDKVTPPFNQTKLAEKLNEQIASSPDKKIPGLNNKRKSSVNRIKSRSDKNSYDYSNDKQHINLNKIKNTDYFFIDKGIYIKSINELVDVVERKIKSNKMVTSSIISQSTKYNTNMGDDIVDIKTTKSSRDNIILTPRAKETADLSSENASIIHNGNKISPFTNINAITISDIMNFCKNDSHKKCLHLKSLFMLNVILLQPKNKLQDLVLDFDNKLPVYVNILTEISMQLHYYKRIEIVLDKDLNQQRLANYIISCRFDRKCAICNKLFQEINNKDDQDFIVAKPDCGHIYHNICANKIKKKLKKENMEVEKAKRGRTRNEKDNNLLTCKVCEYIQDIINQNGQNKNTPNVIMSTITNVVEPVTGVLNVFKTATVGIFDVIATFGLSEKDLQEERNLQENIVPANRKSVGNIVNKDKFKEWVNSHVHTGLQIKLDKLRNDESFKSQFLNL